MRRAIVASALFTSLVAGFAWWRRHRRTGSRLVNQMVNPFLMRYGASRRSRSNLGILEHVGRRSGIRRLTVVHPVVTPDGFRIIVPLGTESEWARNVLAAGHCRMQVGGTVYELDEPALVPVGTVEDVPSPIRWAQAGLGFQCLRLRRYTEAPGTLEAPQATPEPTPSPTEATLGWAPSPTEATVG